MEYLYALIALVVLTFAAGWILDKISSPEYFREQHVLFAGINMVIAVVVSTWFSELLLPSLALAVGTFGSWCLYRICYRRKDQMVLWDKVDIRFLGLALIVGIIASVLTCSLTAVPGEAVFFPVEVLVVAWLLMFPI